MIYIRVSPTGWLFDFADCSGFGPSCREGSHAPTSALPERIEDGKDAMIYDSIKTYRIQLDPEGTMPNIDVGVRVDGRDIPEARVNYVAMIFVDRVVPRAGGAFRLRQVQSGQYS
jgi:hypothetical protein